jgi:hypothetical protein
MELNARGALATRPLPDGRVLDLLPLTFGRARVTVSRDAREVVYEDGW